MALVSRKPWVFMPVIMLTLFVVCIVVTSVLMMDVKFLVLVSNGVMFLKMMLGCGKLGMSRSWFVIWVVMIVFELLMKVVICVSGVADGCLGEVLVWGCCCVVVG